MTETVFRVVVPPQDQTGILAYGPELRRAIQFHGFVGVTVTPMDDTLIKAAEDAVDVLDMTAKGHADDGIRFHCAAKLQDAIANARGGAK